MNWFNTQKLLDTVKLHPVLYDTDHPDYKIFKKKDKAWEAVGAELQEEGETVKKKWKNLKDSYAKYLRSCESESQGGRKSKLIERYKTWPWASQMETFNLKFIKTEPNPDFNDPNTSHEDFYGEPTLEGPPKEEALREPEILLQESVFVDSGRAENKRKRSATDHTIPARSKPVYNAMELIFLGYAKTIQNFSAKRRAVTKLKIAKLIAEQELLEIEDEQCAAGSSNRPQSPSSAYSSN